MRRADFKKGKLNLYRADCMEIMTQYPDNYFDLAIVDPPYGIEKAFSAVSRIAKYGKMQSVNDWKPTPQYFEMLFRVSKNQIVWGYNHLSDMLPTTKEFVFWFKHQPVKTYSDGELAWTSFAKTAKCFNHPFFGAQGSDKNRIHPTQKPIALYNWLLSNYSSPGAKIIDTHLGSGSHAIAAHYHENCGEFVGCEIDEEYFTESVKRIKTETAQVDMFQVKKPQPVEVNQTSLL